MSEVFRLQRRNVIKLTESPQKRDALIRMGFVLSPELHPGSLSSMPSVSPSADERPPKQTPEPEGKLVGKMTKPELIDYLTENGVDEIGGQKIGGLNKPVLLTAAQELEAANETTKE